MCSDPVSPCSVHHGNNNQYIINLDLIGSAVRMNDWTFACVGKKFLIILTSIPALHVNFTVFTVTLVNFI